MKILGLIAATVLTFSAGAAENCYVNDLRQSELRIGLDRIFSLCLARGVCASIGEMNYTSRFIELNKTVGSCGLRGSKLALEGANLNGDLVLCNTQRSSLRRALAAGCETRSSADGAYNLNVCLEPGGSTIVTLAFPAAQSERSVGFVLVQSAGNPNVISVNGIHCGPL